jgi:hypothetical protein
MTLDKKVFIVGGELTKFSADVDALLFATGHVHDSK